MLIDFKIPHLPFAQYFSAKFEYAETLTAREKAFVANAVEQRIRHFSTGRFCAKQALNNLGINAIEILVGADKEPLWPEGIVGSISHSKHLAGAVVAKAAEIVSIGLDIETIGGVKPDMWDMLYLPAEQDLLNACDAENRALLATILFSGKEAFYKFQYPITKTFLDFTDVIIEQRNGRFILKVIKDFAGKELLPATIQIHFVQQNDQIITLCYQQK